LEAAVDEESGVDSRVDMRNERRRKASATNALVNELGD
jgi:hypothetical protein